MNHDVIVVGGGVAGCALAARMARAGHDVLVLEREHDYRDQVRGEGLVAWGLEQAAAMGLGDVVTTTPGASPISRLVNYDETLPVEVARRLARDLSDVLPGTPGIIGVGHPELRTALAGAASAAGASVRFAATGARVIAGERPSVHYRLGGRRHEASARLVVVADGKNSATRRALDIPLHVTFARVILTGLAVDDGGAWDRAETVIGVEGRNLFYVIPRGGDRVRLYLGRLASDPERFSGPGRERRFLDAFALGSLPAHECIVDATPVGPCASFPMTDSWTSAPLKAGVALIGDAAGWSNPVTGQGLAVALRDARILTDAMLAQPRWSPETLAGYVTERAERMRRLRFASALTDLLAAFGAPNRGELRARMFARLRAQPELGAAIAAVHTGPWRLPSSAFSPDILTTLALS